MADAKLVVEIAEEKREILRARAKASDVTSVALVKRAIEVFMYLQDQQAEGVEFFMKKGTGAPTKLVLFL